MTQEQNSAAMTAADERNYLEKIDRIVNHNSELELPMFAPVIAMVLKHYRPVNPARDSEDCLTSEKICEAVAPLVTVTCDDVAAVMLWLGYSVAYVNLSLVTWSMEYVGEESEGEPEAATE